MTPDPVSDPVIMRGLAAGTVVAERYGNEYLLNMLGHREQQNPIEYVTAMFTGVPPRVSNTVKICLN